METLEEAVERIFKDSNDLVPRVFFMRGAKWQQQRNYSEEDILLAFDMGTVNQLNFTNKKPYQNAKEWFEQFKKK